ncbi:MAG: hypothetical protein ACOCQA_00970 [bacterium]
MEVNYKNKETYIRRILATLIRNYSFKWLADDIFHSKFDINKAVNKCSKFKMEQIKTYVYEKTLYNDNYWYIFLAIRDFKDIKDLLKYVSPYSYYRPEEIFLNIIRKSGKVNVQNTEEHGMYYIKYKGDKKMSYSQDEIVTSLKTFFRSYIELLLNIKKLPYNLDDLYNFFIVEEIQYSNAKNSSVFIYLKDYKKKTVKEIIKMISKDNLQSANEVFIKNIKIDHNRFYRIAEDYYGSKKWNAEVKFKADLKLFDKYRKENKQIASLLGSRLLEKLEESSLTNMEKGMVKRLVKKNMEGGI